MQAQSICNWTGYQLDVYSFYVDKQMKQHVVSETVYTVQSPLCTILQDVLSFQLLLTGADTPPSNCPVKRKFGVPWI